MHRLVLLMIPLLVVIPGGAISAPPEPLVDKVRKSIENGVAFLKSKQKEDGNWEFRTVYHAAEGGGAALALLAMMTAGETPRDRHVSRGLEYLRKVPPSSTYTVGLQTMVFAMAGDPRDMTLIQRNVDWLQRACGPKGWTYGASGRSADNSNTQYALLALHEALQAGATVDKALLERMRALFLATQDRNGEWGYTPEKGDPPRITMTTAGLCNLLITGTDLDVGKQKLNADGTADNCGEYDENKPVAAALRALTARLDDGLTSGNYQKVLAPHPMYAIYGVERAGRLTGQRFFGDKDWYRQGCLLLVDLQRRDGYWDDPANQVFGGEPLIATSFALLFLAKGRTPVLISKLAFGNPETLDWNRKRSDMRHLVDYCSKELFKRQPMAWQTFDVRRKLAASEDEYRDLAAELLQSPIVFFNGHDSAPRDKEEKILKQYVDNGGFILAEACCGEAGHNFPKDFKAMVDRMFGKGSLQPLPNNHPVWHASGKTVHPRLFPKPLYGVSQGCKTVLIYCPFPIAGYWEANDFKSDRGKPAFELGANIVAYATGLSLPKPRLTEVTIPHDDGREAIKRGYFKVAQLVTDKEAPPAPRAMRNLMEETRKVGIDVIIDTKVLPPTDAIKNYWFFYMHGREKFDYTDVELKKLCFRLENGGTLLADACCGSKAFDESFGQMIKQMGPIWKTKGLKLEPIPLNDELYSRDLNGAAIETVRCRRPPAEGARVRPEFQSVPPALEGIKHKGRWIVIYSKYDLGCALEKSPSPECIGHDYDSAVKLSRAAVLYSLKR